LFAAGAKRAAVFFIEPTDTENLEDPP